MTSGPTQIDASAVSLLVCLISDFILVAFGLLPFDETLQPSQKPSFLGSAGTFFLSQTSFIAYCKIPSSQFNYLWPISNFIFLPAVARAKVEGNASMSSCLMFCVCFHFDVNSFFRTLLLCQLFLLLFVGTKNNC